MSKQVPTEKKDIIGRALRRPDAGAEELQRRPRYSESLVRAVLLLAGTLSIVVTVGIIVVLGTESLRFFTPPSWIDSFFKAAEPVYPRDTTLVLSGSATPLRAGDHIQLHSEQMLVTAYDASDGALITVERGYNGTAIVEHAAGAEVFKNVPVTLGEFLTGAIWQPHIGRYGVLPLVSATLMVATIAMIVCVPLGLAAAIYLSEYASPRVRAAFKPVLELLAGVPTVVFGYFALVFVTPVLRSILGADVVQIYNTASAGIVVGILIIPTIASVSEDALQAVPISLREASYGLGATRLETTFRVVLPAALSGIVAAFILGVSRAVGETMVVAIAAGAGPKLTLNPFEGAETMTGHILRISSGDVSYDSIDYNSIFAIGLLLFIITLVLNMVSRAITRRFREVYE